MPQASPLMRLAALRGSSIQAAEAAIALWSQDERDLLVRIGITDGPHGSTLTADGRRALRVNSSVK